MSSSYYEPSYSDLSAEEEKLMIEKDDHTTRRSKKAPIPSLITWAVRIALVVSLAVNTYLVFLNRTAANEVAHQMFCE